MINLIRRFINSQKKKKTEKCRLHINISNFHCYTWAANKLSSPCSILYFFLIANPELNLMMQQFKQIDKENSDINNVWYPSQHFAQLF